MKKKVSIILILTLIFGLLNPIFSDSIVKANETIKLDAIHNLEYDNGATSSTGLNDNLEIGNGSETALKFDLSTVDINRIKDVELGVDVGEMSYAPGSNPFINLWGTYDDDWNENSGSIPNKEELLVEGNAITSFGWITYQGETDLTNFTKDSAQENEFVTFVFSGHSTNSAGINHRYHLDPSGNYLL